MSEYGPENGTHERTDPRLRVVSEQMAHVEAENVSLLKLVKAALMGIAAVLAICVTLGGFAMWVLNEARAQGMGVLKVAEEAKLEAKAADAGARDGIRRLEAKMDAYQQRVELKVDRVLELMEKRRR